MIEDNFTFGDREPSILLAFEAIINRSEDCGLSDDSIYIETKEAFDYVAKKLDLTHPQVLALALTVNFCGDQRIEMADYCRHLHCTSFRFLPYLKELEVLAERGYIICNRSNCRPTYRIPYYILEALNDNRNINTIDIKELDCQDLFCQFDGIFDMLDDQEMTILGATKKIQALMANNPTLGFCQFVNTFNLNDEDLLLLVYFAHAFVNNHDDRINQMDIKSVFKDRHISKSICNELNRESHILMRHQLVEFCNEEGFANRSYYHLTLSAKKVMLSELDIDLKNEDTMRHGLTPHEQIEKKQMYYDESTSLQVNELSNLLSEDNYQGIRSRLKEKGFRCGFACLFYGAPGTGKTETVLQLARQTGRDIMQIDVTEIRSKWVGDSEKNIKAVFDNYRHKVRDCEKTPILLFNEADAIISRRKESVEHSVDKMENTIQNIILQEMETLDGILIATTNLEQNMDKAFERRFLYKVKFNKPTLEARRNIWLSMIPSLEDDIATQLAQKFDFSGGQIENIARHYTIDSILHGNNDNMKDTLFRHCENEQLDNKNNRRIGFN
ncbi:ATP-binding protein [Xylanibacter ruminicola]|uniref:ATPase family associated with various cellular activities (AAA) n=1 Tax=Xylanibacter ruminicola TaxID=839 RepID=A0A1M6U528_XYLRU|nr:ATP-binding protein [Xylanibacter ruminicola]SHK64198.1 ATPase family associated with various cellular activities (AAA) [Xylanibacter ruminicola]